MTSFVAVRKLWKARDGCCTDGIPVRLHADRQEYQH